MAVNTLEITGKMVKEVDDATRSSKVDFFSFLLFFFFVETFSDIYISPTFVLIFVSFCLV